MHDRRLFGSSNCTGGKFIDHSWSYDNCALILENTIRIQINEPENYYSPINCSASVCGHQISCHRCIYDSSIDLQYGFTIQVFMSIFSHHTVGWNAQFLFFDDGLSEIYLRLNSTRCDNQPQSIRNLQLSQLFGGVHDVGDVSNYLGLSLSLSLPTHTFFSCLANDYSDNSASAK